MLIFSLYGAAAYRHNPYNGNPLILHELQGRIAILEQELARTQLLLLPPSYETFQSEHASNQAIQQLVQESTYLRHMLEQCTALNQQWHCYHQAAHQEIDTLNRELEDLRQPKEVGQDKETQTAVTFEQFSQTHAELKKLKSLLQDKTLECAALKKQTQRNSILEARVTQLTDERNTLNERHSRDVSKLRDTNRQLKTQMEALQERLEVLQERLEVLTAAAAAPKKLQVTQAKPPAQQKKKTPKAAALDPDDALLDEAAAQVSQAAAALNETQQIKFEQDFAALGVTLYDATKTDAYWANFLNNRTEEHLKQICQYIYVNALFSCLNVTMHQFIKRVCTLAHPWIANVLLMKAGDFKQAFLAFSSYFKQYPTYTSHMWPVQYILWGWCIFKIGAVPETQISYVEKKLTYDKFKEIAVPDDLVPVKEAMLRVMRIDEPNPCEFFVAEPGQEAKVLECLSTVAGFTSDIQDRAIIFNYLYHLLTRYGLSKEKVECQMTLTNLGFFVDRNRFCLPQ